MQQCKLQCLEKELHYMRTQQASQVGHALYKLLCAAFDHVCLELVGNASVAANLKE